ncbi:MAG: hypothetical protein HQK66_15085, partial [Desulfamplus sp.]|nr:hypothetical protein [Desulfamplus sp.]
MDFKQHAESAWKLTIQTIFPMIIMTLVYFFVSAISFGILAPVLTAGYMHSILQLVRTGREPQVQDLFGHFNLFLPLLGLAVCILIITMIGLLLIVVPGILFAVFVAYSMVFLLPLMTDKGMGVMDASRESFNMAFDKKFLMEHAITVVIYLAVMWVGSL